MLAEQQGVLHSTAELPEELPTGGQKNQRTAAVTEEVTLEEKGKNCIEKDQTSTLNNDKTVLLEDLNEKGNSFLTTVLILLDASLATYILSLFRALKRRGMANYLSDSILQAPMKIVEIFRMILECEKNGNIRSLSTKISLEFFSFQVVRERFRKDEGLEVNDSSTDSTILYFDDINQEEELVYSITIHHQYKQVVVAFRGSTTLEDWRADLNPAMKVLENPINEIRENIPTIQVHAGFYGYLHKRPKLHAALEPEIPVSLRKLFLPIMKDLYEGKHEDEAPTKCQIILQHVSLVLRDHPEYSIYVTGHSLGGALATLFAFEVACLKTDDIPKPITCINFASPKVGNIHFSRTVNYLEGKGALRHVRVTNYYDTIPRVPVRAHVNDFCVLCRMENTYTHAGYKARLKSGEKLRVFHAPKFENQREFLVFASRTLVSLCAHATRFFLAGKNEILRYHSCLDYYKLICEAREQLEELDLNSMHSKMMERQCL